MVGRIEDQDVIRKILSHLGLWKRTPRPQPPSPAPDVILDSSLSQLPCWEDDLNQDPGGLSDGFTKPGIGPSPWQGVRASVKVSVYIPSIRARIAADTGKPTPGGL